MPKLTIEISVPSLALLIKLKYRGVYGATESEIAGRFVDAQLRKHVGKGL